MPEIVVEAVVAVTAAKKVDEDVSAYRFAYIINFFCRWKGRKARRADKSSLRK
jgi:hypothetical protein